MGLALGIVLECDLIVAATGTKFQVTETSEALTHRWRPFLSRLPSSCLTLRWSKPDSNSRSPPSLAGRQTARTRLISQALCCLGNLSVKLR